MSNMIMGMIRWYQQTGPFRDTMMRSLHLPRHQCRHIPSCSEYTIQSIRKYGVGKGLALGLRQLLSCW